MSKPSSGWVPAAVTLTLLGGLWFAPVSPVAMSRADVALGQGSPGHAARVYDRVARWTPFQATRAEALRRAAAVHAGELNDPRGARKQLERLLAEPLDNAERADTFARVGQLLLQERRPARAAEALRASVLIDPDSVDAAGRMANAARAYGDAGMYEDATLQWQELREVHEAWRGRANLGLAELNLAHRQVPQALALFEDVVRHGLPEEQSAARLGISVCLEKLGDLDQALAAIDGADLPEGVRRSRATALRARQLWVQ